MRLGLGITPQEGDEESDDEMAVSSVWEVGCGKRVLGSGPDTVRVRVRVDLSRSLNCFVRDWG